MTARVTGLPLSLDPLMAEAKRRMRRRRVVASVVVLALAGVTVWLGVGEPWNGSGSASSAAAPTNLTFLVSNEFGGTQLRIHLTCHPAGGNLSHPASACAAIAARPTLMTKPKPFRCYGPEFVFTIVGRMTSKPVHSKLATCWSSQMALMKAFGLGVPRG
jgi:hypothetical protein